MPSAAGGGFAAAVVVAGPGQGKAGMTGPGQTRPRPGTTGPYETFEITPLQGYPLLGVPEKSINIIFKECLALEAIFLGS